MIRGHGIGGKIHEEDRILQISQIPYVRVRPLIKDALIQFVILDEIPLILGQPSLVNIGCTRIRPPRNTHRIVCIGHVGNGYGRLVRTDADFPPLIGAVRTTIENALRIVDIAASLSAGTHIGKTTSKHGVQRLGNVHNV